MFVGVNMDKRPEVCAVVVTYNRKEKLKRCIECLLSQTEKKCDVIVIDNASTDGTEEMLLEEFNIPEILYCNTGSNLGSAGGFSFGVKKGVLLGYKYIWIMDDDVFPDKKALDELFKADLYLNGEWGCLSSFAYWKDGSICKANRQKRGLFVFLRDSDYEKKYVRAKMVSFASMLVKAEAVFKVGLPIADYFFYTDDYEFSARIGEKYPVYVIPSSKVLHFMDRNIKADIVRDPLSKMYRYETLYRNDVHFYKRFHVQGMLYLVTKFIFTICKILIHEKEMKVMKIKTVVSGYKKGIHFNPAIEFIEK